MEDDKGIQFIDSMALNGPIFYMLKEAIRQNDLEFEWIYGDDFYKDKKKLTKELFLSLKEKLDVSKIYKTDDELNDLDIRTELTYKRKSVTSNIRATLHGIQQIKQYCLQDNFDDLSPTFIKKKKYKHKSNEDYSSASSGIYPMRTTLKEEIKLNQLDKEVLSFLNNWSHKNKHFRYKKRYSYITHDKIWRIDLTAVKSSNKNIYSKTFKESNILKQTEQFELEIEYIGSISETFSQPPIVDYSNIVNESPFNLTFDEGTILTDIPLTNDSDIHDLAFSSPLSPSYMDDIEFDSPTMRTYSPKPLPNTVTIRDSYWKDSENELIGKYFKKGYEPAEWVHENYKLLPRSLYHTSKQLEVEFSPHLTFTDKDKDYTIKTILVPYKYIIEPIDTSLPSGNDDGYTPDSPPFHPESPRPVPSLQLGGGYIVPASDYSDKVINSLLEDLEKIIHFCYSVITDSEYIIDKLEEGGVIREYNNIADPENIINNTGWKFIGPQPISMNLSHLNPLNPHAIMSKYVVTEKADGIRAQLLISDNRNNRDIKVNRGYIITPKKEIIDTGVNFEELNIGSWIFDGEYITQNKNGSPIKLFMIFDVYYSSKYSTQPYTYPWISKKGESRSEIIRKFKETSEMKPSLLYPDSNIRIGFKQYLLGPDKITKKKGSDVYSNINTMFKNTKKIISLENKSDGFEYSTDGLIFLPMYLPVKGSEEGDIVKSIKGTWNYNYKWKPPEENTIDFKVIFKPSKPDIHSYTYTSSDGNKETRYYQKIQLAVDYNEKDDSMIDFNWSILSEEPINKLTYQYFTPSEFKIPNIHMTNIPLDKRRMKCIKDGKDILNGSIVEMRYNSDNLDGFTWTPLRLRDDKVKPQYFTIANNIWNTINQPITESMIKGSINFNELEKEILSDLYYVDTKFAEDKPIRDLHNYIKSKLISRVGSTSSLNNIKIADLSCGRGGDIKKYLSIRNKVEFILGLDISGNINEAAQRYHYQTSSKPLALFLQFDTSKSIKDKSGCLGNSKERLEICDNMLDIIFKKRKSYPKKYKNIQKRYSGIAMGGFDIVSSQFSLHYYFKDELTLRGFCENIKYLCSPGGYFIGTCYDGMKLMKIFAKQDTDTLEMRDNFGSLIYQIKKRYTITDFSYTKDDISDMFGQEIDVFMASIGQHITEYLVNFEFFINLMKEYGFVLELPPFKKGEYNPIKEPIQSFDSIIDNLDEVRERDNNFVKKTYNRDLFNVKKDKGYQLLSGLNNWFVFKKQ